MTSVSFMWCKGKHECGEIFLRVQNKVVKTYGVAVFVLLDVSFYNIDDSILMRSSPTDRNEQHWLNRSTSTTPGIFKLFTAKQIIN